MSCWAVRTERSSRCCLAWRHFRRTRKQWLGCMKKKKRRDFLDTEKGYSYAFKKLSVGLYRESVPQNVPEMIEEAEADGNPLSEEDIEYEKRRTHWATVGIGVENYYT